MTGGSWPGTDRIVVDRRATPGGGLQLQERRTPNGELVYEMIANGVFLMASYNRLSERELGRLALEAIGPARAQSAREVGHSETQGDSQNSGSAMPLRVLVAGLGMGFTLQEVLRSPAVTRVDVVEVESAVLEWNQRYFGPFNGFALDDPRVRVVQRDLASCLAAYCSTGRWRSVGQTDRTPSAALPRPAALCPPYDAICMDVDNGPEWLAREGNARLYRAWGLRRLRALLTPGGVLAVWSADPARTFVQRLRRTFGAVDSIPVCDPDPWGHDLDHVIYRTAAVTSSGDSASRNPSSGSAEGHQPLRTLPCTC